MELIADRLVELGHEDVGGVHTTDADARFAGAELDLVGTDLSKLAVQLAAGKHKSTPPHVSFRFAVAASNRLPFADASLDCVVSVFAPVPFR